MEEKLHYSPPIYTYSPPTNISNNNVNAVTKKNEFAYKYSIPIQI